MSGHPLHIGIVAGKPSGDRLGAGLMHAINEQATDVVFEGVGGPRMKEAGCFSLYPMEKLSVTGLSNVIGHLPGQLSVRSDLRRHFLETPPDIFIGIDAPDFNLLLEKQLKRAGIRTIHYVSPSVQARRRYRPGRIAGSVDCMLTLYPFEETFYRQHHIPVRYVGHPLADTLANAVDPALARQHLDMHGRDKLVALLPGSSVDEVRRFADLFILAAMWCYEGRIDTGFVVPFVNGACREVFEQRLRQLHCKAPMTLLSGRSLEALAACDAALLTSGTATLECMLLKRPMVVVCHRSPVSHLLAKRRAQTPCHALPNLLSGEPLVREFIQGEAAPSTLGREIMKLINNSQRADELAGIFSRLHESLRCDANRRIAGIVLEMVGRNGRMV